MVNKRFYEESMHLWRTINLSIARKVLYSGKRFVRLKKYSLTKKKKRFSYELLTERFFVEEILANTPFLNLYFKSALFKFPAQTIFLLCSLKNKQKKKKVFGTTWVINNRLFIFLVELSMLVELITIILIIH